MDRCVVYLYLYGEGLDGLAKFFHIVIEVAQALIIQK